jgi:hypothetical protein
MRKPIPTTVHGVLDYMTAGLLFALPRMMGWSRCATNVLDTAAIGAVGYSLLTKYELGVAKVLPMKAHLTLDAVSGAALIGAAALMDDEEPEVRATIAGLGVFEIGAALMSQSAPRASAGATRASALTDADPYRAGRPGLSGQNMPVAPSRAPSVAGDNGMGDFSSDAASDASNVARSATM